MILIQTIYRLYLDSFDIQISVIAIVGDMAVKIFQIDERYSRLFLHDISFLLTSRKATIMFLSLLAPYKAYP